MQPKTPKLPEDVRDAAAFIREATKEKTLEVDEGVWRRWKEKPEYRPGSLARHPDKPLP